jgi:hypothetical protein
MPDSIVFLESSTTNFNYFLISNLILATPEIRKSGVSLFGEWPKAVSFNLCSYLSTAAAVIGIGFTYTHKLTHSACGVHCSHFKIVSQLATLSALYHTLSLSLSTLLALNHTFFTLGILSQLLAHFLTIGWLMYKV